MAEKPRFDDLIEKTMEYHREQCLAMFTGTSDPVEWQAYKSKADAAIELANQFCEMLDIEDQAIYAERLDRLKASIHRSVHLELM